jgi:trans-aconitate 2-methyltransferase
MWDPSIYLRYGDERARPFGDLLARVGSQEPREVVDLGCGPGTLTVGLRERWPHARVVGLDSSEEMIASAAALDTDVDFKVTDVYDWTPGPAVDVVLSNALLQWVPGHTDLLRRWIGELGPGRWIALQVPGNFDAPSHRALRDVAARPRWHDRVAEGLRDPAAVLDPAGYAELLTGLGCHVDAWETTYLHLLPVPGDHEHPVLRWMEGTAMRPARKALPDQGDWDEFRAELRPLLTEAYPAHAGVVAFPFRRIFVVART